MQKMQGNSQKRKWQGNKQQRILEQRQAAADTPGWEAGLHPVQQAASGKGTRQGQPTAGSNRSGILSSGTKNQMSFQQPALFMEKMYREHVLPFAAKQQKETIAHKIATGGKLPEGYRWHRTGNKAYATKNFVSKPLTAVTAAGQPAVFGINPSEYVKHMQAIDAYNAAAGGNTKKEQKKLTAGRDAALSALGEDAAQYAGKKPADYYRSYANQAGNEETARTYMENYKAPILQIRGSDAAKHAETMNRLRMSEAYDTMNPTDFFRNRRYPTAAKNDR